MAGILVAPAAGTSYKLNNIPIRPSTTQFLRLPLSSSFIPLLLLLLQLLPSFPSVSFHELQQQQQEQLPRTVGTNSWRNGQVVHKDSREQRRVALFSWSRSFECVLMLFRHDVSHTLPSSPLSSYMLANSNNILKAIKAAGGLPAGI